MSGRVDRPDCELAASFTTSVCGDPECGVHLVAKRRDETPICEVVIGRPQLRKLVGFIREHGLDLP